LRGLVRIGWLALGLNRPIRSGRFRSIVERNDPMKFKMVHENYNVFDLDRSLKFYEEALGLTEKKRIEAKDGSFIIVYVGNDTTDFLLELTWLRDRDKPYDLGDQEFHLAFRTDNFEEAYALHKKMGCICYENPEMGIYFIEDPDGYWLEILPERK
jgi:lactoylglutathione lyase